MPVLDHFAGIHRRSLALSLLGALSACGVAAESCAQNDHHFSKGVPRDLGNGLVLNSNGGSYGTFKRESAFEEYSAIDCATAASVTFVLFDHFEYEEAGRRMGQSRYDAAPIDAGDAKDEFVSYLDANNFSTLEDVVSKAEELGIVTHERVLDKEDCGCAAFYPELLGDQEPAEERNA